MTKCNVNVCSSLSVLQNTNSEHTVFYWYTVLQCTRQIDFVPVLHPGGSNDGSNWEAAYVWLNPQTMVEHMVYHSRPNLIRDDHSPSSFSSSSPFFSLSFSSSSSFLSSSSFSLSSYSSTSYSPLSTSFLSSSSSSSSSHSYPSGCRSLQSSPLFTKHNRGSRHF